jgi:flagellin
MEERQMGLRINTNVAAANTARNLRSSNMQLSKSLERLSSGLRINRAADDAAGLAIAESFRSQVRGFQVAQRNVQDGISLIQTKEGAMSEIGNIMQRMRELAVQSANGTNSGANRTNLDAEYQELEASVVEIIARTDFNGINLFGGTAISVQSGSDTTEKTAILGSGTAITAASLSLTGDITLEANADTAIAAMDAGLVVLNTARAQLGAAQNRLEFTSSVLQIREENAMASESAIRDADIARETTQFTRNQILVNAGTSMLSQANFTPQSALQLLG